MEASLSLKTSTVEVFLAFLFLLLRCRCEDFLLNSCIRSGSCNCQMSLCDGILLSFWTRTEESGLIFQTWVIAQSSIWGF